MASLLEQALFLFTDSIVMLLIERKGVSVKSMQKAIPTSKVFAFFRLVQNPKCLSRAGTTNSGPRSAAASDILAVPNNAQSLEPTPNPNSAHSYA